ncbi:MAG: thioredoxin [Deltaproteobacteria bacterium]|nr:thioredoxin [Deltaproteobacteria bacterium]
MSKKKKRKDKSSRSRPRSGKKPKPELIREVVGLGQWKNYVLESENPVVVDFWAPWCGPCRLMTPILEKVSKDYQDSVRFAKLNTQSNAQIARNLNIRSIPTLIVFYRGEVADVSIGVTPADRLHKMIRRVLDKHEGVGFFDKMKRLWRKPKQETADQEVNNGDR